MRLSFTVVVAIKLSTLVGPKEVSIHTHIVSQVRFNLLLT